MIKIRITSRTLCLVLIPFSLILLCANVEAKALHLEALNISIPILKGYEIIEREVWKNDLKMGQQFIMVNLFDFDYLIQKYDEKSSQHPFESSFFLIKAKRTREITDQEFTHYVEKYIVHWEKAFKEKQRKGLISNLIKPKVIQKSHVNYQKKYVLLKALIEMGDLVITQIMYSAFFPTGNLVVLFTPVLKDDEKDFAAWFELIQSFVAGHFSENRRTSRCTKITETILSKVDTDVIFNLTRREWEVYARKMVHPEDWKVRLSPHDTGTGVMAHAPETAYGLSVQPLYRNNNSPPDMLIVGSYFPLGTLPKFTHELKCEMEAEAKRNLGAEYSVSANYTKMLSFEGIELMITKATN